MKKNSEIFDCFVCPKGPGKRRILNILKDHAMTPSDLERITGINEGLIHTWLNQFVAFKIVEKVPKGQLPGDRKMTIYKPPFWDEMSPQVDNKRKKLFRQPPKKNFIHDVFKLFNFSDPLFKRDLKFVRDNQSTLKALTYYRHVDRKRITELVAPFNVRNQTRRLNGTYEKSL